MGKRAMRSGRGWPHLSLAFALAAMMALALSGEAVSQTRRASVSAEEVCARLNGQRIAGAVTLSTERVVQQGDTPAFCKVTGVLAPSLNFELRFPEAWNGKLYYEGGSGFNGSVPPLDPWSRNALAKGYVVAVSDSGHQGVLTDARFALDPYAAQLWGSLSVPAVTAAAARIVKAAYGAEPARAYFEGCSNGGREGLMAIERNPNLFDGVIARAPAFNPVGFFGRWLDIARLQQGGGQLSDGDVRMVAGAVRGECDALDGLTDGLVSDLKACASRFEVARLECKPGQVSGCLTDAKLAVVRSWLEPKTFGASPGHRYYGAYLTGNEDGERNWLFWMTGRGDFRTSPQFRMADSYARHFVARDTAQDGLAYPYDRDRSALYAAAAIGDATQSNLSSFRDAGGKLILWHGGADAAFSPRSTWAFLQEIVANSGGVAAADRFIRAYEAPGVGHCTPGDGADSSDLLGALDRWVEDGAAPETLQASRLAPDGGVEFTRPLCRRPTYAHYVGGDRSKAESFQCRPSGGGP